MKTSHLLSACLFSMALFISCAEKQESYVEPEETTPTAEEMVERGAYLVETNGCAHCHTPKKMTEKGPVPDLDKWLMGYPASDPLPPMPEGETGPWVLFHPDLTAAAGPWGTTFSGNLTPHETGIGSWTLEQFKKAITQGKYKGMDQGRPMMPPMPLYNTMKDEDVEAIFAYLQSIDPIENVPPSWQPPAGAE